MHGEDTERVPEIASAYSRVFLVAPPPTERRTSVELRRPDGGDEIFINSDGFNSVYVQFWIDHAVDSFPHHSMNYTLILLKGGEEVKSIGPTHISHLPEGTPRDTIPLNPRTLSGSDYQVKLELHGLNEDTGSRELIDSDITGNFSVINSRVDTHSDGMPLILRRPGNNDSFAIGSTLEIQWSHLPRPTDHEVRLTLTRDSTEGGGEWPIAANVPADDFSYDWIIPDDIPPGPGYRVLIERMDGSAKSNSSLPFRITP
jgi:hypothetical protein